MVVDVHKTRNDILIFQIDAVLRRDGGQNFSESSVFHAEGAVLELTAHENIGILKKHIIPPQTLPPLRRR